ncbi:hypothetical protein PIROE2DRAFT_10385, partial [Piromyces sp. E2]
INFLSVFIVKQFRYILAIVAALENWRHLLKDNSKPNFDHDDPMDLDNISYYKYNYNNIKECVICGKQGHLAMNCYNPRVITRKNLQTIIIKMRKINSNNRRNNNRNNYKSRRNQFYQNNNYNNNYNNYNNYNNNNNVDNMNIILITKKLLPAMRKSKPCMDPASEHITNNINLLENFTKKKFIMKCANKSHCLFEGYDETNTIKIPIYNNFIYDLNTTELNEDSLRKWHFRLGHYYQ